MILRSLSRWAPLRGDRHGYYYFVRICLYCDFVTALKLATDVVVGDGQGHASRDNVH